MKIAITREISPRISECELAYQARRPIDLELARRQHAAYEQCLARLGCAVHRLEPEPGLPDSVFVEDTALVLDELAVITRPGAESRRPETKSVAEALGTYRTLHYISAPGTLDGGDFLCLGKRVFVGLSKRSNPAAMNQLGGILVKYGYSVTGVPVAGCLHLKSAVTRVAADALLVNRRWVDTELFGHWRLIEVDPLEATAANALLAGEAVVFPSEFPETRRRLEVHGIEVRSVDMSELAKAEGGVTCCSLIFTPSTLSY